ncbi:MAG: hypothetical protein HGJ94_05405 [Desulfosarcina sp.]|nr:hypothetical protein [Desulfosarcina sp.]
MTVLQANLLWVVKRFPDHKANLLQLSRENRNFKIICDDYRRCSEALKKWRQSASETASARSQEYADLLQELELEIIELLNETDEKKFPRGMDRPG